MSLRAEVPVCESQKVVYSNPWFSVREDQLIYPDGSEGFYGVIKKEDFVLIIPSRNQQVCLIRQYRYPAEGWFLEFPQGGVNGGHSRENLCNDAENELAEETGISAKKLRYLGSLYESYGLGDSKCHIFLATDLVESTPAPETTELITGNFWVSRDQFWSLVNSGKITDAPTVAAMGIAMSALPEAT